MARDAQARLKKLFESGGHEQVVAVAHEAARPGRPAPLPDGLHPAVVAALAAAGIERLWSHQRETYDLLADGKNVVVSTGTASGKSLCFAVPTLDAAARDPQARALYLYPTKALAQDQARKLDGAARGRAAEAGHARGRRRDARRRGAAHGRPRHLRRRHAAEPARRRSAATRRSSSRTPTCCTSASCRRTSAGPSSFTT